MSFKHDDDVRFFLNERNDFISNSNMNIDLVLFGDSITRRFDLSRYLPNEYRILNSGIGGDNIQNMIRRLYSDVLNLNPRNVLFMGGINNLRNCLINNDDFIKCKYELMSGYKEIINQCKKNNVNLTMCLIIKNHETNLNFSVLNNWIDEVNNEIRELCINEEIGLINYNEVLTNEYGQLKLDLALDGLHPEEVGFLKMTKYLYDRGYFSGLK